MINRRRAGVFPPLRSNVSVQLSWVAAAVWEWACDVSRQLNGRKCVGRLLLLLLMRGALGTVIKCLKALQQKQLLGDGGGRNVCIGCVCCVVLRLDWEDSLPVTCHEISTGSESHQINLHLLKSLFTLLGQGGRSELSNSRCLCSGAARVE